MHRLVAVFKAKVLMFSRFKIPGPVVISNVGVAIKSMVAPFLFQVTPLSLEISWSTVRVVMVPPTGAMVTRSMMLAWSPAPGWWIQTWLAATPTATAFWTARLLGGPE